jgi:CTP:phosphocholine cytidylyltransferase-like protein
MNKVERAIILAAGKGERMLPLTKSTPKPLIEVLGQPIIEHTIEILHQKNIFEIYIVVGYLSEKFNYLSEKYNVTLVKNPLYNECNNISSMFFAKDYLKNSKK